VMTSVGRRPATFDLWLHNIITYMTPVTHRRQRIKLLLPPMPASPEQLHVRNVISHGSMYNDGNYCGYDDNKWSK